jgi:hypothetical protein
MIKPELKLYGILIALITCGFLILPSSAVVSDPYSDSCVFEGDPFEPALIQPESAGGFYCFTIDPDNPVLIGEYIQDTYPDVWEMLSPDNQEYYNTMWAVWPCGWDDPMLPNEVIRLLRVSQALSERQTLEVPESTFSLQRLESASSVSDLTSKHIVGDFHLEDMRSNGGSVGIPDAGELIAGKKTLASKVFQ